MTDFQGTDRFQVQRKLGSGTSGAVYEVFDRERKSIVALKTLRKVDAAALYRFKKEFRSLADVNHRNLSQLYELLSDGENWFFTMELVKGRPFTDYVRGTSPIPRPSQVSDTAPTVLGLSADLRSDGSGEESIRSTADDLPVYSPCRLDRLRPALAQLAEGLSALHEAGKLHCDIKPSNVLVTREGRVVLLDLGLVRDLFSGHRIYESLDEDIVGTPAYMSPEQAAGLRVAPTSDWYSVGAMLYEALTGRLPYTGSVMRILTDKQKIDPAPPSSLVEGVPEDLDTLTRALLHRDPESRPSGREILRWLGSGASQDEINLSPRSSSTTTGPFVGRQGHLNALKDAYESAKEGRTVALFCHGTSGMGKTALVRRFLKDLGQQEGEVVVLTGRCYQRESVPYKALDSLVDSLSRYLRSLPQQQAELLMPYNILALARLFPVLQRVKAISTAKRRVLEIPDSRELRRRAFAALRELFLRLCDRCPVVLFIDDLQWGDLDSAALLNELLRPPDPPPLLLIASFRSEEALTSPLLKSLFSAELTRAATEVRELVVKELDPGEAKDFALQLLGGPGGGREELADTIGREARGNPFFVDALVRYAQAVSMQSKDGSLHQVEEALGQATLEKAVQARLDRLPLEARQLLEVVAVAGQPLELSVAEDAAGLIDETQSALAALRAVQMLRMRSGRERDEVETYHDRIREVVVRLMPKESVVACHRRLAQALETSGRADPETLTIHYQEAGERDRAAEFAGRAAERASDALAFDRAARLFRIALDLAPANKKRHAIEAKLADALANSGRGAEAAQSYLAAADAAEPAQAIEFRRRAAEQLLISGRIDKGLAIIGHVLRTVGMELPNSPKKALVSLLLRRTQLRVRGLEFKERPASEISSDELLRIDACWSVSVGLGFVDTIRGMDFGTRAVLLSLKAGEPYRIARALAIETGYSATAGSKKRKRTEQLTRASMRLAQKVGNPHALGLANLTAGIAAYLEGRWRKAAERLERAEEILRERCTGVTWEIDTAFVFHLRALLFIGEYGRVNRRLPPLLKEVQERGDLYAETNLRSRVTWLAWLCHDDPDAALKEAEQGIQRWSMQGFHLQHYWHMIGVVECLLYSGSGLEAWERLTVLWEGLASSMLLRIQFTSTEAHSLKARAALAAAAESELDSPTYKEHAKEAGRIATNLESQRLFWADPMVHLLRAGLASTEGDQDGAEALLDKAIEGFQEADMLLSAAAARRRRGQLVGGPTGRAMVEEADTLMKAEGIQNPLRMTAVLAPGNWPEA